MRKFKGEIPKGTQKDALYQYLSSSCRVGGTFAKPKGGIDKDGKRHDDYMVYDLTAEGLIRLTFVATPRQTS